MIEWVTVDTTNGKRQHAIDSESELRAGIYRRAECGHEVAMLNVVPDSDAKLCTGCVRKTKGGRHGGM